VKIILPPDPYWLLRLPIKQGECIPMVIWFWWHFQFRNPSEVA
jgi:hypothetical protein